MLDPPQFQQSPQRRWTFSSFESLSEDILLNGDMEDADLLHGGMEDADLLHSDMEDADLPHSDVEDTALLLYNGATPYYGAPIVAGPTARHAVWPPVIMRVEKLGYLSDGCDNYPRDFGRSSLLGKDGVIFQLGDKSVHNAAGRLIGGNSSHAAVVMHLSTHPTVTLPIIDDEGKAFPFIQMRPEEQEQRMYGMRTTLWCFGGIIDIGEADSKGTAGWVFYQKGTQLCLRPEEHTFHYTGAAKVIFDHEKEKLSIERMSNPLVLFKNDEPSFGTFCAVKQGANAYLFGHAPNSAEVMLARVNIKRVLKRNQYSYWDGKRYQGNISKAKPIMDDVQTGAIYQSKLFEPRKGRDWLFVGCSRFNDNKVLIGVSANLEGPYTFVELISTFPIVPAPGNPPTYCVYPHPWAFKEEDGELMITWSEGSMTGGVVAVKVQFAMTMEQGRPSASMRRCVDKRKGHCVIL